MNPFHDSRADERIDGVNERLARAEQAANEILDARAAGATLTAREMLREASAKDPLVLEVMRELEETVHLVKARPSGPDLSGAILDAVHAERPFLARRARRKISVARVVLACSVLAGLGTIAVLQRLEPGMGQDPVMAAIDATRQDAVHSLRSLASAFDHLASSVEKAPLAVDHASVPLRRALSLGSTDRYEGTIRLEAGPMAEYPGVRPFGPGPGLFAEVARSPAIMPGIGPPASLIAPPSMLLGHTPVAMIRKSPELLSASEKEQIKQDQLQTPLPPDSER